MTGPVAKYLPYLDGWRGLAIVFLLIGHFLPVAGINLGSVGVSLFFVLSGHLMARILFIENVPIPTFYRRRISRIFPAVFFFLTVIIVAYAMFGRPLSWREAGAAALFLNNYFPGSPGEAVMPFGHIWSLCVEEHSYIVLSLVALAARARLIDAKLGVALGAVICVIFGTFYATTYNGAHLEFDRWMHSEVSAFGIFISAFLTLHLRGREITRVPATAIVLLGLSGLALHWWSVPTPLHTFFGVTAFALAVNLLQQAPDWLKSALSLYPLKKIGLWSFSIYLWQQPFYLLCHREGLPTYLGLGLSVAIGVLSYYTIELPARNYLNRVWAPRANTVA